MVIDKYYLNKPLKYFRHDAFIALILVDIFNKFLELFIRGHTKLSTVLQACNTVAWSRSPIWEPIFAKEAFRFFAKT
jgi:hypothetical protein